MKNNKKEEYLKLVNYILNNEQFNKLSSFSHHGTNRLRHSIRVSYYSYLIAKKLRLDYKTTAISGLLHDFYIKREEKGLINFIKFQFIHPKAAALNAIKYFSITNKERNIIETHMCPFTKPSKYSEGWIVSIVDKTIAIYEYGIKFKHQIAFWFVSLLNIIK